MDPVTASMVLGTERDGLLMRRSLTQALELNPDQVMDLGRRLTEADVSTHHAA